MSKISVIGIAGESVFLSLDEFAKIGETKRINAIHRELGGKGFNQAVAVAKWGVECSLLCAVNKCDKQTYEKIATSTGIKPFFVPKDDESPYAVITTDKCGKNSVYVYRGCELNLSDISIFENEIRTSDLLLINNEVPPEVNEAAVKIAKANGIKVILNPAPYRCCDTEFLKSIDLFTPNEHESLGLEEFTNVVVTLGEKGCEIRDTGEHIPAFEIENALDTTGAGDTFCGVVASCLVNGMSLHAGVKFACAAAAIKCSRRYILNSIPTKEETENFLKEREK